MACSPGTYKPTLGSASCSECPFDSWSPEASDASIDCSCNAGYYSDTPGGHCNICDAESYCTGGTSISPCALFITPIVMLTFEEDSSAPATFAISLSGPPAGSIIAEISTHPQLSSCSPGQVFFSPDKYGPQTISCYAMVDDVLEGPQAATLVISLEPTTEIESYGPLSPATVEIQIGELSCPIVGDGGNYRVFDCNRLLGGSCHLQCRPGFHPQLVSEWQCIKDSSGQAVWTGQAPSCQHCLSGYYSQGIECLPCPTIVCQIGQYLACAPEVGSICLECTNAIPDHAYYSSAGDPYDSNACGWACQPGYLMHEASISCLENITYNPLVIETKSPTISEEPGTVPAIFSISLSDPPVSNIWCRITYSVSQLYPPSDEELVFTPSSWATQQNVTISAIYDGLNEGTHSGWFSVRILDSATLQSSVRSVQHSLQRVMSCDGREDVCARSHTPNHVDVDLSIDPRFVGFEKNLSVIIVDYNCPALELPVNGNFSCSETSTEKTCIVSCEPGYDLDYASYHSNGSLSIVGTNTTSKDCQLCAWMTCNKSTLTWNKVVPQCTKCRSGFFNQSGSCQACSTLPCPAGQYRGKCMPNSDSVCTSCTTSRPAHSHFTAGGIPSNLDNCSWACDQGYYLTDITGAQTCEKTGNPNRQPSDSDEDGIPDETEGDDRIDTDHDGTPDYLDTDRFSPPPNVDVNLCCSPVFLSSHVR